MPYDIVQRGSKWCVVKQGTNKSLGCHSEKKDAIAQRVAIVKNERAENLTNFESVAIEVSGENLSLYVAYTPEQHAKGLLGFEFFDRAGMVFMYNQASSVPFHMDGMEFDLDIAWFDADGELIKRSSYSKWFTGPIFSPSPYHMVIESPAGTLSEETVTEIGRTFTTEQRKKLAGQGKALPDGSFPIKNVEDLKNAIKLAGRASNPAAARRHIKKRAKALGATGLIPEGW